MSPDGDGRRWRVSQADRRISRNQASFCTISAGKSLASSRSAMSLKTRRFGMFARIIAAAVAVIALSAPAWAADRKDLQVARDVSKQVLTYPQFSIFDSVHMQLDEGV